ncbi:MAG: amidohydrolase family protein [Gammaproteobacteria bacterium]|nr:amidohydrolase family protein [Gammaproteobacteria bacterium]MDH3506839.1 amidohydrolase family protein [Gammaproteobacteria bacterium]
MNRVTTSYRAAAEASVLMALSLLLVACGQPATEPEPMQETAPPPPASTATAYTGARVIVGNGNVIENATFVVDNGEFTAVGAAGSVSAPAGAAEVDLSGMTVMPMIIDSHVHTTLSVEGLTQDMQRRAVMGVSAALSMGRDAYDELLALRDNPPPMAARFRTAGRGISRPEPGRPTEPHWVDTTDEAREAVRTEAARRVDIIKVWVDDRDGQYPKITPELFAAIIDEAHLYGLRVAAHIFTLEDGKDLVAAGVDVLAHGVRDRDIDDEFVEAVRAHPELIMIPNLPERGVPTDLSWLEGLMPADELAAVQAGNVMDTDAQEAYGIQARNLARLDDAGMRIAMGTDGNVYWGAHIEMEDMVVAGMSPADVLVSATSVGADVVGIEDAGTIEPGKYADFIVLEANPIEDIRNTRRIADVYFGGQVVDRTL